MIKLTHPYKMHGKKQTNNQTVALVLYPQRKLWKQSSRLTTGVSYCRLLTPLKVTGMAWSPFFFFVLTPENRDLITKAVKASGGGELTLTEDAVPFGFAEDEVRRSDPWRRSTEGYGFTWGAPEGVNAESVTRTHKHTHSAALTSEVLRFRVDYFHPVGSSSSAVAVACFHLVSVRVF